MESEGEIITPDRVYSIDSPVQPEPSVRYVCSGKVTGVLRDNPATHAGARFLSI